MTLPFSPAVQQRIQEKMATGMFSSEDELLLCALKALDIEMEELSAIQAGLDYLERGDPGAPLDDAFNDLRRQYGLPSEA